MNVFHQDSLVLEHITFHLKVETMVPVCVCHFVCVGVCVCVVVCVCVCVCRCVSLCVCVCVCVCVCCVCVCVSFCVCAHVHVMCACVTITNNYGSHLKTPHKKQNKEHCSFPHSFLWSPSRVSHRGGVPWDSPRIPTTIVNM